MKKRRVDFAGNAARAKRRRQAAESTIFRITCLVDGIESKKVRTPSSLLAALVEILPAKPENLAPDEEEEENIPRRKRPTIPEGEIDADRNLLTRLLLDGQRDERIGASACIAHVAKTCPAHAVPYGYRETADLLRAGLEKAISDDIPEIQRDLLAAFPVLQFGGDELLPVFVGLLSSEQAEVRQAAIIALRCSGKDRVSVAVESFAHLLADPVDEVRLAACLILEWLERDAAKATPALVDCVQEDGKSPVGLAAAKALLSVDPKGRVLSEIKNQAKREALIDALSRLGEDGRQLRRSLPHRWAKDDESNPPKWMSLPEIARETGMSNTTLQRRLDGREIVPHGKQGKGKSTKYLVTEADLKAWKRM